MSNNSLATAQSVILGTTVTGSLSLSTEVDYYKVTLSSAGVLRYDFSSAAPSSTWSYSINIKDAAGNSLASTVIGYGYAGTLQVGAPTAGDYYVSVAKNSNYYSGQYSLTLSKPAGNASDYETGSDSSLAGANPLALDHTMTGQVGGTLKDYYQLTASADGILSLDFAPPSTQTYKTFSVKLLDASGLVVQTVDTGSHQTLFAHATAGASYFVEVDGKGYDSGNYSVTTHLFSNGAIASSQALSPSTPISAAATAVTPALYQVNLVAGTTYEFWVKGSNSGAGSLADPSLSLLDARFTQLESCDNLAVWATALGKQSSLADPQIAFTAPASGTYYLSVSGNGGAGSYILNETTDAHADLIQDVLDLPAKTYARWNGSAALGTSVSLSYSFLTSSADLARNPGDSSVTGLAAMTDAQKAQVRNVLAIYGSVAGISFSETSNAAADIRFGSSDQGTSSSGVTHWWATNGSFDIADVLINNVGSYLATMTPGGYGYQTLIHEIGHALGLKHPGDYDSGGGGASPPYIPLALDSTKFTVMSYVNNPDTSVDWTTPALLDIAAVQYLYGVSNTGLGQAHSYKFSATTPFCEALIGSSTTNVTAQPSSGGGDTIDISNQSLPSQIYLTAGCLSSIGAASGSVAAHDNLSIPFGQLVTSVIDGPASDLIVGNSLNNSFYCAGGADSIDGGAGIDTAIYAGSAPAPALTHQADGSYLVGTDTLKNVERVQFGSTKIALDTGANQAAGEVVLLLNVVFGPWAVSNTQLVGIGLGYLDAGMSYPDLMQLALTAAGATSHVAVVDRLWQNLFNAPPANNDAQVYIDMLDHGDISVGALAVEAANLALNASHINLVGLQASGIHYS